MIHFFNIYTYNVDIFIIVFIFSYCNIRYVVLFFGEIKTHNLTGRNENTSLVAVVQLRTNTLHIQ